MQGTKAGEGFSMGSVVNSEHQLKYRPEVDGLRAVAVLAVLFYHAGLGFPGGFVGVDVFFVISGFLVTSLIFKDIHAGEFSYLKFMERRARRILPAALAMTIAVLIAGWFLLLPGAYEELGQSSLAQAFFSANIYFWRSIHYFARASEEVPLLHTWSLAVEEQFYFIAPVLFVLLHRLAGKGRGLFAGMIALAFVVSFGVSTVGLYYSPGATFYLLPTRAWELLTGSIVALLPSSCALRGKRPREIVAAVGFAAVLISIFGYKRSLPFPGPAALLPCVGTALVIWANGPLKDSTTGPLGLVGRLLAWRPVVFVGLISYSLYLWHWPLMAFTRYRMEGALSSTRGVVLIVLSFFLAVLSWRYIESPFRRKQVFASRRAALSFGGAGLALAAVAGALIVRAQGFPVRMPPYVVNYETAAKERVPIDNRNADDVRRGNLKSLGAANADKRIDFLVWGDSHARTAEPALARLASELQLSGRTVTHSATAPLLGFFRKDAAGLNEASLEFGQAVLDYVKANRIPRVFLICFWEPNVKVSPDKFSEAFEQTVQAFNAAGARVYVMLQVPHHRVDVPKRLAFDAIRSSPGEDWRETVGRHQTTQGVLYGLAQRLASQNCVFFDPAPLFVEPGTDRYRVNEAGESLYADAHHLTAKVARTKLYDILKPAFADLPLAQEPPGLARVMP
jgi:peptidoglycan/LPS O-acetylase OafA/YrhL